MAGPPALIAKRPSAFRDYIAFNAEGNLFFSPHISDIDNKWNNFILAIKDLGYPKSWKTIKGDTIMNPVIHNYIETEEEAKLDLSIQGLLLKEDVKWIFQLILPYNAEIKINPLYGNAYGGSF